MNNFFDRIFLDNPIRDYLWVIGVILFVLLLNKFISKYIAIFLCKVFKRAWKTFDQQKFVDLIIHPLGTFLVVTVSIIAFYRLNFPEQLNVTLYRYPLKKIILSISIAVQIIALTWLLLRVIDFIATVLEARANKNKSQTDNQLIVFFRDFLKVIVGIIGGVLLLHFAFNYNVGSLLTGLSIVGAAIALSLRESLENLIASFVIFFDKPFTTGDIVKVQNVLGTVERIGLRSTRVRTIDKSYVTVPNKQMVDSILDNISLRSQIRGEVNLFINLQTSPQKIQQLLDEIKKYLSGVKEIQAQNVLLNDIRVQAFIVFIEFFTPPMDWNQFTGIKQDLNFFVLQTIDKLEIRIAAEGKDVAITT
jgi:MscS family membrane protein